MDTARRLATVVSRYLLLLFVMMGTCEAVAGPTSFKSDDFNAPNLRRPLWTFVNPRNDAFLRMEQTLTPNASLVLTVPGGTSHLFGLGGNFAPHILQTVTNTDFDVEVKFFSGLRGVSEVNDQTEGIIVKADSLNLIRFDFTTAHLGVVKANAMIFAGGFGAGNITQVVFKDATTFDVTPLWMRVKRVGNTWTQMYSTNGTTWDTAGTFTHTLAVTKIGLFAENGGDGVQDFTMAVDYFFNRDSVIAAEDGATSVPDSIGPLVHSVRSLAGPNAFRFIWNTDEPVDGVIEWGLTTSYELGLQGHAGPQNQHSELIESLVPGETYYVRIHGTDWSGNADTVSGFSVTLPLMYTDEKTAWSDDFNPPTLDTPLWTVTDKRGDATISTTNKELSIALPAGVAHDLWVGDNTAVRVMQTIPNQNFEASAKFTAAMTGTLTQWQSQGIIVWADTSNWIRFGFGSDNSGVRAIAISNITGDATPGVRLNVAAAGLGVAPLYLRVTRYGARWTMEYSLNGTTWSTAGTFYHMITMGQIGVIASNQRGGSSSPPAFTARVDYFRVSLPAKPYLATPANATLNVPLPVTIAWDTTSKATSYRLQVASDTAMTSILYDDSTLTTTSKQVPGLNSSVKYFWRVRGKNTVGIGQWPKNNSFTTAIPAPGAPTAIAPADAATGLDTSITTSWTTPATATSYHLQLGTDAGFTTGLVVNDSTLSVSNKDVNGLAYLTTYYWHVRAKNAGGYSAYTTTRSFVTRTAIPSTPVLVSPATAATNQSVTLSLRWRKSADALTYRLQVGTDASFAGGIVYNDSTLTDTVRAMSSLANNTKYYWRVNAKNVSGTSVFSAAWDFTTIVANPSFPVPITPADGATDQVLGVRLAWTRPVNAVTFRLQVGTDSTFATGLVKNDSTLTDTSWVATGLSYNARFFWRVNGKNAGGTSGYSPVWSFRTLDNDPAVPRQLAPADRATGLDIALTLRWTRPAGASSFHLQVSTDSTLAGSFIVDDPAMTDTLRALAGLSYQTTYFWRVNADAVSGTSPYSPVRRFSTGIPTASAPVLLSPAPFANIYPDSVKLMWQKSQPAVDKYWVDLAVDTNFTFVVSEQNVTDTTKVFRGLLPNQSYFWRVRANNAGGWGPYSAVRKFIRNINSVETQPEIPTEFVLGQNYPNPFNPSTMITFGLPSEDRVTLEVFNLLGERVATLVNEVRSAGYHAVRFDASTFASGVYLYRIATSSKSLFKKMLILK